MTDYLVTLNEPGPYRIGVDYEIPTKAIQYGNIILDELNAQFTGIAHTFGLTDNGSSYVPINDQQLIVVKNNLVMEPIEDYTTSTNNIIFTVAPSPGDDVFIIALATTADLTRTINYIVDGGNAVIAPGNKGSVTLDVSGIIESVTVLCDQEGSVVVDIQKSNYSTFPTFSSILGGSYIQLINQRKYRDDNLTGWSTNLVAGDILTFEVPSASNISRFLISLKLKL
jgi:hypothetical protein